MPPILALALCAILVVWLLRKEIALRGRMSGALWIPLIWLLIYGSRPVASWLGTGGETEVDGNQIDAVIAFGLIIAAFVVLNRRRFQWGNLISLNSPFFILFCYFVLSIIWTIHPFVACKRLFKEFGQILLILVILTEANPIMALKQICIRSAILLFPLSVVLIKYYPGYGRSFSVGGFPMLTGVTTQKNSLGEICCIYGLFLLWVMMDTKSEVGSGGRWKVLFPTFIIFAIGIWLLLMSESKTCLLAFLIGAAIFLSTRSKLVSRSSFAFAKLIFLGVAIGLVITAFWTVAVAPLLEVVGRDATFTERTMIWNSVLKQDINPLIGCGFYSFWLEKGPSVWKDFDRFKPHSAHDGYLELYLDGGMIGCFLMGIFLVFTSWRLGNQFSPTNSFSRVLFAITMMALIINFSEAYFFRLSPSWFFLVFAALASHPWFVARIADSKDESQNTLEEPVHTCAEA